MPNRDYRQLGDAAGAAFALRTALRHMQLPGSPNAAVTVHTRVALLLSNRAAFERAAAVDEARAPPAESLYRTNGGALVGCPVCVRSR